MSAALDIVNAARSEVGYTESPRGSNRTKFAAEAGLANGVYWCAVFVSAIFRRCGVTLPGAPTASTRALMTAAKQAGLWVPASAIEPGFPVLYHVTGRNGPGQPDHVGIAVARPARGRVVSVDGNTSSTNKGSQDNGGGVYERSRPLSAVLGAVRPNFTASPVPPVAARPEEDTMFTIIGWKGGPALWYFYPALGRKVTIPDPDALADAIKGQGFAGYNRMAADDVNAILYLDPKKNPAS